MPVLINNAWRQAKKTCLTVPEAAFILQRSEVAVRNLLRRGQRLQGQGLSDEEILEAGALPVFWVGRSRRIRPLVLAAHPDLASDSLALEMLGALVEDRVTAPRSIDPSETPPSLADRAHQLNNTYRHVSRNGVETWR